MIKRWLTRRNLIIVAVILAVGGGWWWKSRQQAKQPVKTYTVTRQDVKQVIVASGQIAADTQATLHFPSSGKVAYLNVHEGDAVRRWQALTGMDTADLAAAQTAALYRYQAADANAKEVEDSVKGHAADETFAQKNDRVAAQTNRDIAYDNWLEARRNTRDAHLISPLAGIVTQVYGVKVKLVGVDLTRLRLGMNGDARIVVREQKQVLSLPLDAVVDGQVKLPDGQKKPVEVGLEGETAVEIKSGLNEGDVVWQFP